MNRIFLVFIILIGICACSGKESFVQVNSVVQTPVPPTTPATPADPASFNISISKSLLAYYSTDHLYLQGQFKYLDSSSNKPWQKHSLEFAPSEITSRTGFTSLSVNGSQVCGVQGGVLYCWTDYPRQIDTGGHTVNMVDHAGDWICIINNNEDIFCRSSLSGTWEPRLGGAGVNFSKLTVTDEEVCGLGELASTTVIQCANINSGATITLADLVEGNVIKDIASYNYRVCALRSDDNVICNYFGDDQNITTEPMGGVLGITGSSNSVCAYTQDEIKCIGDNILDEDGDANDFKDQLGVGMDPVVLPAGVGIKKLSIGQHSACVIGTDDKTYCWGRKGFGFSSEKLALLSVPALVSDQELVFTEIYPDRKIGCGILDNNGELFCFKNYNVFPVAVTPSETALSSPIEKVVSFDYSTYILSAKKLYRVEGDHIQEEPYEFAIKDAFFNHDVKCLVSESEEDDEVHCFSPGYNHRFTKSFGNDVEEVFLGKSSRHLCVKTDSHNKVWCTILSSSGAWSGELNNVTNYEVKKIQDDMVLFNDGRLGYIDGNNVVSGAGAFSFTGIFDDLWAMPKLFNDSFYGTFLLQEGVQYSSYKYDGADIKNDVTSNIQGDIKDIQTSNNTGCIHYVNEEIHCYGNNTYGQIGPDLGTGISLRELELPSLE